MLSFNPLSFSECTILAPDCVGQNIAKLQLFHSVFKFYRECGQTKLAPETTDESMAMVDYFAIKPVAEKCIIVPAKL